MNTLLLFRDDPPDMFNVIFFAVIIFILTAVAYRWIFSVSQFLNYQKRIANTLDQILEQMNAGKNIIAEDVESPDNEEINETSDEEEISDTKDEEDLNQDQNQR